jgi:predicted phosphodiesterase
VRIQLASDLHLERVERRYPQHRLVEPAAGADLLVLAGDIHNGTRGVEAFLDWPVPVVYVACAGTAVTVLDEDVIELQGTRILGCTMWTDFQLPGSTVVQAMQTVEQGLTDYRVIRTAQGPLRAAQILADHERSRHWLTQQLALPFDGATVVVTHHAPHPLSIHARFAGHPINAGFVSDLTPLLADADLWLHGHTHDSFDYRVGRCRVVANPAGYLLQRPADDGVELENARFDPRRIVEL